MTRQQAAENVAQAYDRVQNAFASRRKPLGIAHCSMCYREDEIAYFLSLPYQHLTANDLRPIFWDAYVCWGTWPQVAYYVPRLLELYAEEALAGFEENLFAKLLLATRPELASNNLVPDLGELMSTEERRSIFELIQAILEARLRQEVEYDRVYVMEEALSFLAAFDTPLKPFLDTLRHSESSRIRANVCALMADRLLEPLEFGNVLLENYSMLPENAAALMMFLAPSSVAPYLLEHIEDVQRFDIKTREQINYAFDWAMSQFSDGNETNYRG